MTPQQVLGFVFLTGMLVVLADYEATASLAAAIAFLFLAGVLVVYGPDAFGNIGKLVGQDTSIKPTKSPGSAGGLI